MSLKILPIRSEGLTPRPVPVIFFSMDTAEKLRDLFRLGWSLQVAPELTAWGCIYATVVWSRKRDEIDETLDGPVAALPLLHRVNLADPNGFADEVAAMYERVFPISPFGDIGDDVGEDDGGGGGDIPEREL